MAPNPSKPESDQPAPMPAREVALRSLWIMIQLFAVYLLAEQVSPFFYQQF